MNGVLKMQALGHTGSEAVLRYTSSDVAFLKFSMAVNKGWKDKNGEWQDNTKWVRVTVWRKLAEVLAEKIGKGALIYVEGEPESRAWVDKDGNAQASLEVQIGGHGTTIVVMSNGTFADDDNWDGADESDW